MFSCILILYIINVAFLFHRWTPLWPYRRWCLVCFFTVSLASIISSCLYVGTVRIHKIKVYLRESSFNMTRGGWRYWGGRRKFLDTRMGGSEKIRRGGGGSKNMYTSKPTGGGRGLLKYWTASEEGLLKFQASSCNIFIPHPLSY